MPRTSRSLLMAAMGGWSFCLMLGVPVGPAHAESRCSAWAFHADGGFEGGEPEASPDCAAPPIPVKLICHGNKAENLLIGLRFENNDLKEPSESADSKFKVVLKFPDTSYTVSARYEGAYPDLAHYINDPSSPIIGHLKSSPFVDIQIAGIPGQTRVSLKGASAAIGRALKGCK